MNRAINNLISRTAAIEAVLSEEHYCERNMDDETTAAVRMARFKLEKVPTVDAAPVTHAEWVYDPDGMDWNLGAWKCSKCHCRNDNLPGNLPKTNPYRWAGSKYCPNCGAKMETRNE